MNMFNDDDLRLIRSALSHYERRTLQKARSARDTETKSLWYQAAYHAKRLRDGIEVEPLAEVSA